MWLSTSRYHLSSNLSVLYWLMIWSTIFIYPPIQRSTDLFVSLPFLSCPVLSCPILSYMSFLFMWHVYLSSDLSISFFFYIFIEFNRLIDPIRLSTTLHSWYSPLHYTGQAEMDALATSIGMEKKSEAYGLVHSALAEREVQKVLETRWFYCSTSLFYFKWHFIP